MSTDENHIVSGWHLLGYVIAMLSLFLAGVALVAGALGIFIAIVEWFI